MLNPVDTALQTAVPTVMVPRFEEFEPLNHNGHRFLATVDGFWLEARRPWLYLRCPLVRQLQVAMPYGKVKDVMEVRTAPRELLYAFVEIAKRHCPLECAAWIVWNSEQDTWKLTECVPHSVSSSSVAFDRPSLGEHEHLVVDLHSHGRLPAFFSSEDNRDDRGEFKVSGVFGQLDGEVQAEFRLCANGLYIDLGTKWEANNHG